MHIYSKNIYQFINHIKLAIHRILSQEVKLKVEGLRFYDFEKRFSFPIKIVIFNDRKELGYFDAEFFELGFHERLQGASQKTLENTIKHELAHYLTFIKHGPHILPHGIEFKQMCLQLGWQEDIYKACVPVEEISSTKEKDRGILRKVHKLMALTASGNAYEAEQAMIKSQKLLVKHNMEKFNLSQGEEKQIFVKRLMKLKKRNAKMHAIALILETFFVSVIYNRTEQHVYLEVLGDFTHVEIAEYVAIVLNVKMDTLWQQARQKAHLKGALAKNSFFKGIAKGYCEKIKALKHCYDEHTANALMVVEKELCEAKAMVYKHLTKAKHQANYCSKAAALGQQAGKLLTINPALKDAKASAKACLAFQS